MAVRNLGIRFRRVFGRRGFAQGQFQENILPKAESKAKLPEIEYNVDYICNPANRDAIFKNVKSRRRDCDIDKILELSRQPQKRAEFLHELSRIPNMTDPKVLELDEPKVLRESGVRPTFSFKPLGLETFTKRLLKKDHLGPVAGQRAYSFIGDLANLEQALVNYSLGKLRKHNFKLVSVPDILPTEIISRCGLVMDNERHLVYELDDIYGKFSLSGTAEMALAYMLMNETFNREELPLKLGAVSRCFRAEVSRMSKEKGIFRVHQFTKVEMFGCSEQDKSEELFDEFVTIQEEILKDLGLWYKVLDMPPYELGSPAYRKIDIEGWMPGKQMFGELTSCSNCTDYQSRRLNIKYKNSEGKLLHVHTLNGTACAVPRSIIAIGEKYQQNDKSIAVPEVLIPYMNGRTKISEEGLPDIRSHKYNPRK